MSSSVWRTSINYLEDTNLSISTKDGQKKRKIVPPKIKGKHFTNMEYLVNAEFIWLTPNLDPSRIYDYNSDDSYFEQCFRTCGKLGEGSFGSVIKVKSVDDDKLYAMKVSKEPFKNEFDRKQKIREVEHHQSLSHHANIVTLYKAWEEDRFVFMQLELCKPSIEEGIPLSEQSCWNVLGDILQALDHIHESGRGHFDVKVENILLGQDNLFKLSDFGLMLRLGQDKEVLKEGDAKYVAPELILGGIDEFTPKADIFSLGISVLELAGNLELPTCGDVWTALREDTFPLAQTIHLSDDLFELLMKMMASDPAKRPSAKEILALPKMKTLVEERKLMKLQDFLIHYADPLMKNTITFVVSLAWSISITMLHLLANMMSAKEAIYCDPTPEELTGTSGGFIAGTSSEFMAGTSHKYIAGTSGEFAAGTSHEFIAGTSSEFMAGTSHKYIAGTSGEFAAGTSGEFIPFGIKMSSASTSSEADSTKSNRGASMSQSDFTTETASSGEWSMSLSSVSDESAALVAEESAAAYGEQPRPTGPLFSSTPMCMPKEAYDANENFLVKKIKRLRRERSESLNSDGMEDSAPSSIMSPLPPSPPPAQIFCDWVGITSPDRAMREASVNRNRLHCPAESLLQYGISPLRLSKACKRYYREQKQAWETHLKKKKKVLDFESALSPVFTPRACMDFNKFFQHQERLRTMTPRNLAQSFDEDMDEGN